MEKDFKSLKKIVSLIAIITILLMFIVSGIYKFSQTDKYISILQTRIGGSEEINRILILCAGLLQLLGSLLIIVFHTMALLENLIRFSKHFPYLQQLD